MPRYCVTVTRPEAHFVDAGSLAEAAELGIMAVVERARPAYYLTPQADAQLCADESAPQDWSQSRQSTAGSTDGLGVASPTREKIDAANRPPDGKAAVSTK